MAGESAAWRLLSTVVSTLLELAVSMALVHVVNPQSFHWTMELRVPVGRLAALAAVVMAVKEDW